jgi:hypothetical protein
VNELPQTSSRPSPCESADITFGHPLGHLPVVVLTSDPELFVLLVAVCG